ncbi:UBP-type zinc finger domain-containing protein [Herbiconiux sp. KACC 21604]|uniref:UBP-type zinc finger domain-containing protein n=1 Tax=unclassified Herbiconiux TaxID=2618217 RepID=UPI0014925CED|nr:UBP-type zinc finger domain-containing protein [Herbiconiux sp. SALV-R1]QJU55055.1 UBP-type zinc finger domain-containing protein [Herbiconiux sp. SALV-R1]WPO86196.1 UBP-type zinc finger domain-containing protein [Herbiconiux sp. KACC 21604]
MTYDFTVTALRGIDPQATPSGPGCADCDPEHGWWFHLRRCAQCGHIGCCDSSPSQHATAHFTETGHPLIQSYEPGEDWFWDYETASEAEGPHLAAPTHHPLDQPAPGPRGHVPANWQSLLH